VRGEYTKTKVDRVIFLTEEVTQQLKSWLGYKYRTRRVSHQDKETGKTITANRTPDKSGNDSIFAVYQSIPNSQYLYHDLSGSFACNKKFYSAKCGKPKDYIMTNSGPDVFFRSDNMILDFKNFSVREIQALPTSFSHSLL
jgi:hypothetical protein